MSSALFAMETHAITRHFFFLKMRKVWPFFLYGDTPCYPDGHIDSTCNPSDYIEDANADDAPLKIGTSHDVNQRRPMPQRLWDRSRLIILTFVAPHQEITISLDRRTARARRSVARRRVSWTIALCTLKSRRNAESCPSRRTVGGSTDRPPGPFERLLVQDKGRRE